MKSQSQLTLEPQYLPEGDEFGDGESTLRVPKWRQPQTDLQRKLLGVFGMKYWPRWAKELRHEFIVIEKSAQPTTVAFVPDWPIEWVEYCIKWVQGKRRHGCLVGLQGFMSLLKDDEAKNEYSKGIRRKNKEATFNKETDDPYA